MERLDKEEIKRLIEKYDKLITDVSYYRPKDKWLTLYCGFISKEEGCAYIMRYREALDVYKEDCNKCIEHLICELEGKTSINDFSKVEKAISKDEAGRFAGA